jgi:hypothetical protein
MVIKREDYHIFVDENGKILAREPFEQDRIRLISISGIRGIQAAETNSEYNIDIMEEAFQTALTAAEDGHVILPAIGMGVWQGPPQVYWPPFLGGVLKSENRLEKIFVAPGHQQTNDRSVYNGCRGEEFERFLADWKEKYANSPKDLEKLNKIVDLHKKIKI